MVAHVSPVSYVLEQRLMTKQVLLKYNEREVVSQIVSLPVEWERRDTGNAPHMLYDDKVKAPNKYISRN